MAAQKEKISSAQIRAARALLDWSVRELSERSGVSRPTIYRAETTNVDHNLHQSNLTAIRSAFERAGIEFMDHSGVQLRQTNGKGWYDLETKSY